MTGGLTELDLINEMNQVPAGLSHLDEPGTGWTEEEQRARLIERKTALLDRIAAETNPPKATQQAGSPRTGSARSAAVPTHGDPLTVAEQ